MKKLCLVLLGMMICGSAFAALTPEEENFVGQLYTNRQKLVDLYNRSQKLSDVADNMTDQNLAYQKLKLDLTVLEKEYVDLREVMEAELGTEDATCNTNKTTIRATHTPILSAKEGQINAKKAEIEMVLNP